MSYLHNYDRSVRLGRALLGDENEGITDPFIYPRREDVMKVRSRKRLANLPRMLSQAKREDARQ